MTDNQIKGPTAAEREEQDKYWPGFTVRCDRCHGFNIRIDNSLGFSAMSGSWGSIDFVCKDCGNNVEVVSS